jgi:ABC-type bacteriocin/lantibiotic exporter with double-glycine peptidase domain
LEIWMSNTAAPRALRDTLSASAASLQAEAHEYFRHIARDAQSFFHLLRRTLSTLPGDVLAASIVINFLGLALPLGILQIYDRIIPNSATPTLALLSIGIGMALIVETILRIARSRMLAWSAMKAAWKANVEAACRVAAAPAELVDAQPAARWLQRLHAVATLSDFGMSRAPLLLIDMVFVIIFVPVLLASSGWLAAVPVVVFVFFGIAALERGRTMRHITAERAVAETKVRDFLVEALNDIVTVKALGTEQQILRRFERLSEQAAGCTYRVVRLVDDAQLCGTGFDHHTDRHGYHRCHPGDQRPDLDRRRGVQHHPGRAHSPAGSARGVGVERDPRGHGSRGDRKADPRPAQERRIGNSFPRP